MRVRLHVRSLAAIFFALWAADPAFAQGAESAAPGAIVRVTLDHAAYAHIGVPSAMVHVPAGFDADRPLRLVVFLHGYDGCAPVLMGEGAVACRVGDRPRDGWGLAREHARAGTNTLFVIPQLALLKRDGDPGCFARTGCFRRFVEELLGRPLLPHLHRPRSLDDVEGITLVAHSAGFESALAIIEHGQVDERLRHVVLLDALYAGTARFARWLSSSQDARRRLVSIHLGRGKTAHNSERLAARLRRALGRDAVAVVGHEQLSAAVGRRRAVIARGRGPHRRVPQRYLSQLVRALWSSQAAP